MKGRIWNFITLRTKKGKSKENVKSGEKEEHGKDVLDSPKSERDSVNTYETPHDKFKELPPIALKVFKSSSLTTQQVLDNWGVFLNCLYYSTPKKTFAKPPPIVIEKREQRENSLVYPADKAPTFEESGSSKLSEDALPFVIENYKDDTPRVGKFMKLMNLPESKESQEESFSLSEESSDLEADFDAKTLTNPEKNATLRRANRKKKRRHFSQDELDKLVIKENPKDLYKDFREIGRGAYGKVYIATDKSTKKKVAIKHIKKDWDEDADSIANEIALLDSCHHINVLNYICSYLNQNRVWLVTEYCDAGTLKQLLVIELSEPQISNVLQQILTGLAYLHAMHRIHRDIKSANILINMNGDVKVADLGLMVEGDEAQTGMAGSKYWMAPEMIKRQPYSSKVDIWSVGATAMEMMEGSPPYGSYKPLKALFLTATAGSPAPKKPERWSETFKDFLQQCFVMDPSSRPGASELLKHTFMSKACEKKDLIKALKLVFLMRVTAGL